MFGEVSTEINPHHRYLHFNPHWPLVVKIRHYRNPQYSLSVFERK